MIDRARMVIIEGDVKGQARCDPAYDLNGDGAIGDENVALCFQSR